MRQPPTALVVMTGVVPHCRPTGCSVRLLIFTRADRPDSCKLFSDLPSISSRFPSLALSSHIVHVDLKPAAAERSPTPLKHKDQPRDQRHTAVSFSRFRLAARDDGSEVKFLSSTWIIYKYNILKIHIMFSVENPERTDSFFLLLMNANALRHYKQTRALSCRKNRSILKTSLLLWTKRTRLCWSLWVVVFTWWVKPTSWLHTRFVFITEQRLSDGLLQLQRLWCLTAGVRWWR